jgi:hypothetical protein
VECEKFESLLIDELYGELDEVTSAAVKRHAAGCARCGALLSGFRATRKVAALPIEQPSADLEDRILSAVREQQKVLPFRARMSTALSRAGAWAMRPQTAMAAVFLLVIGTSFVLVQSRKGMETASRVTAAEGAPVAAAAAAPTVAASAYALESKDTAFAHGVAEQQALGPSRTATLASADLPNLKDKADDLSATPPPPSQTKELAKNEAISNAGPIAGVPAATATMRARALDTDGLGISGGGTGGGRGYAQGQAPPPADALTAARNDKAKNGCTAAVIQQYEDLRARAGNTGPGNDATMDVGRCYRATGDSEKARARFSSLLQSQAYGATAQSELDQMTPASMAHKAAVQPAPRAPVQQPTTVTTPPAQKASSY